MYFVYRDDTYIDVAGKSFRDFMAGRLPEVAAHTASMGDWADHTTTVFQEVRHKTYMEMRGAAGGPWNRLCALPDRRAGLLYDKGGQGPASLGRGSCSDSAGQVVYSSGVDVTGTTH